jgi:uncharacterized protein (UPF0332 family)
VTDSAVREAIARLSRKGARNLAAARDQYEKGAYDIAVSRGYYAMFYFTEALLLTKNLRFSKHTGVISAFGEHFAKPNLVTEDLHRMLLNAYELRSTGDYEYMEDVTKEETEALLADAERFIAAIREKLPPGD